MTPAEIGAAGAAGVAIPVDDVFTTTIVAVEPIRREAVHVLPRACSGNGHRQTQKTTATRLLVLVLVERRLPSAE